MPCTGHDCLAIVIETVVGQIDADVDQFHVSLRWLLLGEGGVRLI
jgi:hypothetical protein